MKGMTKDEKFMLIKGKFIPADAKELLLSFINHKINYHALKNFSDEERFGKKDKCSRDRVAELKKMKDNVLELIDEAVKENKRVRIDSVVKISIRK